MKLKISTREVAAMSVLIALGAVARIGLGRIAIVAPIEAYGVLVKIGLTETLAFVCGFVFGPILGFITGALIIAISDLLMIPGPWTPCIGAIIGIFGIGGGVTRRVFRNPTRNMLVASSLILTVLSEFLQNLWFALFFGIPIVVAFTMAVPTFATALINNTTLFVTVGSKTIKLMLEKLIQGAEPSKG